MPFILILMVLSVGIARAEPTVLRGTTMGTTYHIKLAAGKSGPDVGQLHREVEDFLAEIDLQMSTYRPDSELSEFNRAQAGQWFPVSAATAEVVAAAQEISEKSLGAMDITVGPLVRLWHFGPVDKSHTKQRTAFKPPSEEDLNAARASVGYRNLEVRTDSPALRKKIDGLEVDLSSIASGYAIDRIADMLVKQEIANFMVELGGEIRAAGRRPDGQTWRVGIASPRAVSQQLQSSIPLLDAAVATAGDYQKFFEHNGRRYSHIIDPATGRPIEHALASVTVVADTCLEADGWDTPLLVLGPVRGFECAERNGIAALFISHGGKSVRATTAWQERFGDE